MSWFRYVGDVEHIHLGPPVRVLSPGEVVAAVVNPDPDLFEAVCEMSGQVDRVGRGWGET